MSEMSDLFLSIEGPCTCGPPQYDELNCPYCNSMERARKAAERIEADRDRLAARVKELEDALREIMKKEGAFSNDPLQHCSNAVDNMADIANDALSRKWQQGSGDAIG